MIQCPNRLIYRHIHLSEMLKCEKNLILELVIKVPKMRNNQNATVRPFDSLESVLAMKRRKSGV